MLVTELCKGGELFDAIVQREGYSEGEARQVAMALLDAVAHCHRLGIVHRDLKPENLLLAAPAGEDGGGKEPAAAIRVADFGFATQLRGRKARAMVGSAGYMAPEIVTSHAGDGSDGAGPSKGYGFAADMWSVGVILYVLLCGYLPFDDDKMERMFAKVRLGTYTFPSAEWSRVSHEAKDLVKRLLVVRPSKRLTAEAALKHPWFELDRGGLDDNHLREAAKQLRRFHARRRLKMLRSAVWVKLLMMKRFGMLGKLADKVAQDVAEEEAAGNGMRAGAADTRGVGMGVMGLLSTEISPVVPAGAILDALERDGASREGMASRAGHHRSLTVSGPVSGAPGAGNATAIAASLESRSGPRPRSRMPAGSPLIAGPAVRRRATSETR